MQPYYFYLSNEVAPGVIRHVLTMMIQYRYSGRESGREHRAAKQLLMVLLSLNSYTGYLLTKLRQLQYFERHNVITMSLQRAKLSIGEIIRPSY